MYVDSRDTTKAYILNLTDITNVRTVPVKMPKKEFSSFNLLAQILPSRENFANGLHYSARDLVAGSIEYNIIAHLLNSTMNRGIPRIVGITKL